jgi:hypothetical protein
VTWEPDYVTSAELKAELRITDAVDDTQIARWVTAASRAVDNWCHRQFGQVAAPETRTYRTADWDRHISSYVLDVDDFYTITGLVVTDPNGTAVAAADYELLPDNALLKGKVYERILVKSSGKFTVTAAWGWSAVPISIKQATLLQAQRFAARRDSPYGVAGSPSEGSELRLLAKVDPDVEVAIGKKYRREWWAVGSSTTPRAGWWWP